MHEKWDPTFKHCGKCGNKLVKVRDQFITRFNRVTGEAMGPYVVKCPFHAWSMDDDPRESPTNGHDYWTGVTQADIELANESS